MAQRVRTWKAIQTTRMPQIIKTQNYIDDVNYYVLLEQTSNNLPMIIRVLQKIEIVLNSLEINPRQYQLHRGGTRSFNVEGKYTVDYEFDYTDKKTVHRVDDSDWHNGVVYLTKLFKGGFKDLSK